MNWFIAALIALPSVSLAWLALKQAQAKGVSHAHSLAQYFFFVALFLVVWHAVTRTPLQLPHGLATLLLVLSAIVTVGANLLIMYSFQHSSNPGLSLALFATQSIWITLGGIVFFGARLTLGAGIGVLLVFAGILSLHFDKKSADFRWAWLALAAAIFGGGYWLLTKAVQVTAPDLGPSSILFYQSIFQVIVFMAIGRCRNHRKDFALPVVKLLAVGGLIGAFANFMAVVAVTTAPNPGYAHAVIASNALMTLVLSRFLFGSSLRWKHLFATAAIVAGIVIIRLWS